MSFRKTLVLLLLIGALAAACAASPTRLNYVRVGMTKPEVIGVMGEPSYTAARPGVEVLTYRMGSGLSVFENEYIVRLVAGKVDLYGQRYDWNVVY